MLTYFSDLHFAISAAPASCRRQFAEIDAFQMPIFPQMLHPGIRALRPADAQLQDIVGGTKRFQVGVVELREIHMHMVQVVVLALRLSLIPWKHRLLRC